MQNIKARKGDKISIEGKNYRLGKSTNLRVTPDRSTDTVLAPQQEAIQPLVEGEQKSDPAQAIDKGTVLGLIQEEINVLEKHENDLMMDGLFDLQDDLDLEDQQRGEHYKTANYAATTVHIMTLKSLYKKVQNLS